MKLHSILCASLLTALIGCTTDKTDVDAARREANDDRLKAEHKADEKVAKADDRAEEKTQKAYDKADEVALESEHEVKNTEEKANAEIKKTEQKEATKVAVTERKSYADSLDRRYRARSKELKDLEKAQGDTAAVRTAKGDEVAAATKIAELKKAKSAAWDEVRTAADSAMAKLDRDVAKVKAAH